MTTENLREYGLPKPKAEGIPTWEPADDAPPCPNCGGKVCRVQAPVSLQGARTAHYLGCPACPWASPAVCILRGDT